MIHPSPRTVSLLITILVCISAALVLFFVAYDLIVTFSVQGRMFGNPYSIPHTRVGLLLGTAKYHKGTGINPFYRFRIEAAQALYFAGAIDFILVSGDNGTKNYNEPIQMRADLVHDGVPEKAIILDYAGFRTLDSIIRLKEIFGQTEATVISQPFHLERALYIGRLNGLKLYGFKATDVGGSDGRLIWVRERFARVRLMFDMLLHVPPKYLGKKEYIAPIPVDEQSVR